MLGIVIVNYNGEKFQNECLDSIFKSSYKNFKVIIVDNGSTDNSMNILDKYEKNKIIKIFNNQNLGVATGNNIGIKKSIELGCEATLLLNNDTEIMTNTLEVLMSELQKFDVVSPKILYWKTEKIWYFGGSFDWLKARQNDWNINKNDVGFNENLICDYAPTCSMLINNNVFQKIGLMDENYFLYYDDTDFCMRLYDNKIKIRVTKDTYIYHKVSMSTGKKESPIRTYYLNRNRLYFYKKYKRKFSFLAGLFLWGARFKKIHFGTPIQKKYVKKAYFDYKNKNMGKAEL